MPAPRFSLALVALAALLVPAVACAPEEDDSGAEPGEGEEALSWEPVSTILGDTPNFAQTSNGNTLAVVSRGDGRGAKAGALVELFYPRYAQDNLWDSYVGVGAKGRARAWAHDLKLVGQRVVADSAIVQSDFEKDGLRLRVEDVMRPGNDAHLRRVVLQNTGQRPIEDVDLTFYAFFTLGTLPGGDRIAWDPGASAFVQVDEGAKIAAALVSDRPPNAVHCGYALRPLGKQKDARHAAERGVLEGCTGAWSAVTGVNGAMRASLGTLAPGASVATTYAIGLGPDAPKALSEAQAALAKGFDQVAVEDRAKWAAAIARARIPARLPAEAVPVYRRALITMLQHQTKDGAFIAAPTLTSPGYRFVWPRDGAKTATDALAAGYVPEAERFFELLEKLLLSDGSFAVNYQPDGSAPFWNFGPDGNENDQPGMLPWGVAKVFDVTKNRTWLAARWPAVYRVAEHLVRISEDGLVAPSRDLWELETGKSWTYANGSAVAGLEASASIATNLGQEELAARYRARAEAIRKAMDARLVSKAGYFARGEERGWFGKRSTDDRVEIANLALGKGGFGIVPDRDPRLALLGELVTTRLSTEAGSIRRYEGDRYYGGQAWPVAAAWLAAHEAAKGGAGDAKARALFATMTRQARTTGSLMLGEQFDETKGTWVSAMPLVWSEAAYIRTALTLY